MNSPRPLRGAIIGCGYFGQIHLASWSRIPEVEVIAACDIDPARAQGSAPRVYSSAEEMLERERLDFVDIATRPETHLPLLKLIAERKLPVICQKPMASSWEEALSMVEVAETAGIRLMIHENWRWQPWYRVARQMIERGDIGQPIGYSFRTRRRDGQGPNPYPRQSYFRRIPRFLVDEGLVHYIDTARYLFGDIATIYAQARRINPAIIAEDQAVLVLTHCAGLMGCIDGHRFLNPHPDGPAMGEAVFEGDEGSIVVAPTGDVYRGTERVWENRSSEGYRGDSVRATQQHFIACLRSGAQFESAAREYLFKTFGAVEAAYRSIAEKRAIDLCNQ